jgi:heme A synthase
MAGDREDARVARRLAAGFAALTASTLGLIVLGALVRAHGAGLACPDWPLCFGRVVPEMDLRVAFEWSHRVLAGSISIGFALLAASSLRRPALRQATGRLLLGTAAILGVQILLGALTVWRLLASWTVTSHLVVGNAFAVCLLLLAVRLWRLGSGRATATRAGPRARGLVAALAALLVAQMVLGGLVSSTYAGLACPEWPQCNGGAWFPSLRGSVGLHLLHRGVGYLLAVTALGAAWRIRQPRGLARALVLAGALAVCQVAVGVANVLTGIPVEVTGLHSALAAALVLTTFFALHEAWLV